MKKNRMLSSIILVSFLVSIIAVSPVSAATVGLVAEWDFDEGTGSVAYDSENGNNGELSGGKFGNALYFDGVSSYVSVPTGTLSIAGPFTVEAWIYRNALGDLQYVLSKDDGPGDPESNYNLLSFDGNKLALFLAGLTGGTVSKGTAYFDSGGGGIVGETTIGVDGLWHHVAGVFTGSELQVYLDGVLDGSVAVSGTPYTNTAELWIGNRKFSPGYFNGKIDEVRISNDDITSFDLSSPPSVDPSTTVALWHFDESFGTTVFDETLNNNDGTIHGAAWAGPTWTTGTIGDDSLTFDGVDDYVEVANNPSVMPPEITIEAWVKPAEIGTVQSLVAKWDGGGHASYLIRLYSNNKFRFYTHDGSTTSYIEGSTTAVVGEWYKVRASYDGTYGRLYVDDVLEAGPTPLPSPAIDSDVPLRIGASNETKYDLRPFEGVIDQVRIWNTAFEDVELAFTANSDSVVAYDGTATLEVLLTDAGNEVEGVTVEFSCDNPNLDLSPTSDDTDSDGLASISASGPVGVYIITASADTVAGTITADWTLAIYDPDGGFVTGGGWIDSPEGAYAADPDLTGKATFGFVSKYKKGATAPDGNTEFQFKAAGMNFKSTSYQWLVVQGKDKASFKGFGTINGGGNYGFMLSVKDGGKTDVDTFRIKIWDIDSDMVVYDNMMGSPETDDAATVIQGGSIIIHTK